MPRKTERRHQQGDASRQRILAATLDIAAERGYDGTSVGLVTERTGLPASSIYWHFKNKDELLAEALEFSYEAWREVGPPWNDPIGAAPLEEQVVLALRHAATALAVQPEFWRLGLMLALEHRLKEPAARARYIEIRNKALQSLTGWWTRLLERERSDLDPAVPREIARFHLAALDGIYVGTQSEQHWDGDWLIDTVASGLAAAARRMLAVAA